MNDDSIRRTNSNNNQYCRNWTKSSIECYNRGCKCAGCTIFEIMETPCDMKRAVRELYRKFGAPPPLEKPVLTPTQQSIIDAIKNGASNRKEIAQATGHSEMQIQGIVHELYIFAESDGVKYSNKRYKLGQFIEWVRDGGEIC